MIGEPETMGIKATLLIIIPSLGGGGQERMAINTYSVLEKEYDVRMVVFDSKNEYSHNFVVYNVGLPSKSGVINKIITQIKRGRAVKKIKKEIDPSVSFSIGNTANITNVISRNGDKIITSIRNYNNVNNGIIDRFVYKRSDKVLCISNGIKKRFDNFFPKWKDKSIVIYNGLDIPHIKQLSQVNCDIDIEGKYIITMGRLNRVKGFEHLIPAFSIVSDSFPDEKLVIIGKGEMKDELEEIAQKYNVANKVVFIGFQSNPYSYLKKADAFVMSSLNEGFCNAIVEAMACSLPIVSTNCFSGPQEILGNSENEDIHDIKLEKYGILTPAFTEENNRDNVKKFGEAIRRILSDKELNEHYRACSSLRAEDFSLNIYKRNLETCIRQLLGEQI